MRRFFTFLILCSISVPALSQKTPGVIRGILQEPSGDPLSEATVSVLSSKDSSLISFSLTSNTGFFEIKNLDTGSYYLMVSYQGFETLKKSFLITAEKYEVNLGVIKMDKSYKTLSEVIVKDQAPIQVKGDTLAYNADAFPLRIVGKFVLSSTSCS